jgi:hypothetical protein
VDGSGLVVEAWDGRRYHSYAAGDPHLQPFPEARDGEAMLMLVVGLRTRETAKPR